MAVVQRGGQADLEQQARLVDRHCPEHRRELHVHLRLPLDSGPASSRCQRSPVGHGVLLLHGLHHDWLELLQHVAG